MKIEHLSEQVRGDFTNIISKRRYAKMLVRKAEGQPINPADVYVEPGLTNISVAFVQDEDSIAQKMAPSVPVETQNGKYASFDRTFWFRDEMAVRTDAQEAAEGTFGVTWTNEYKCPVYAWKTRIGGQARANAQAIDLDQLGSNLCGSKSALKREVLWFSAFFKTNVWSTQMVAAKTGDGGVADTNLTWLDASAKPVSQLKKLMRTQWTLTGRKYRVNKFVFSADAWDVFCEHPNVVNRINAGQTPGGPAEATPQMVAGWLGVDEVLVGGMVQTTSAEGQSGTYANIATPGCVMAGYVPTGPAIFQPAACYSFDWIPKGSNVGGYGLAVASWYEQNRKAQTYEVEMATQQALISADCGLFASNLLTAAS